MVAMSYTLLGLLPYRIPAREFLWGNGYEGSCGDKDASPSQRDWLKEVRAKFPFILCSLFCFCLRVWHDGFIHLGYEKSDVNLCLQRTDF